MTDLESLNRSEWGEVPYRLRLVGGPADGQEITWSCLPQVFRVPIPTSITELLMDVGRGGVQSPHCIEYVQTGSVADDGARLYRMRRS